MNELQVRTAKSILASKSVTGAAGKTMVVGGAGSLAVYFLAGLIPFVGPVLAAVILIGFGLFLWE